MPLAVRVQLDPKDKILMKKMFKDFQKMGTRGALNKALKKSLNKAGEPIKKDMFVLARGLNVKGGAKQIKKVMKIFKAKGRYKSFNIHINVQERFQLGQKFPMLKHYTKAGIQNLKKGFYKFKPLKSGRTVKLGRVFKVRGAKMSKRKIYRRSGKERLPLVTLPDTGLPSFYNIVSGRFSRPARKKTSDDPRQTPLWTAKGAGASLKRHRRWGKIFAPVFNRSFKNEMMKYARKHKSVYTALQELKFKNYKI